MKKLKGNSRKNLKSKIFLRQGLALQQISQATELSMKEINNIIQKRWLFRGVILGYTLNNLQVVRFEPPLIITEKKIDKVICLKRL